MAENKRSSRAVRQIIQRNPEAERSPMIFCTTSYQNRKRLETPHSKGKHLLRPVRWKTIQCNPEVQSSVGRQKLVWERKPGGQVKKWSHPHDGKQIQTNPEVNDDPPMQKQKYACEELKRKDPEVTFTRARNENICPH
jgi:hypothetical protein